jgi:DNA-binding response OmpR family regulator
MKTVNEPLKVLLVDDDRFVHEMVELLLDKSEFSLTSAENVAAALQVVETDMPDIVITDAMMPGESGFGLIEKLRANPRTQQTPIILLTILMQSDGSVMDASGKADISVSKPLYLSDILAGLDKAKQLMTERRGKIDFMFEPSKLAEFVF